MGLTGAYPSIKRRAVAMAVLFIWLALVGLTFAGTDVRVLADAERRHYQTQGFVIPRHGLLVFDYEGAIGMALGFTEPVRYFVLLLPWYVSEAQARAVIAHEYSHLLIFQSEVQLDGDGHEYWADVGAACYGSAEAQDWARRVWAVSPTADKCSAFAVMVGREPRVPQIPGIH